MNATIEWIVPTDHPAFAGHFPGRPILPGVVLLDAALHAIATGCGMSLDQCEVSSAKFLSPVAPGDALVIQYATGATGAVRFDIVAGTRKIASGSVVAKSAQ